MYAVEIVMHIDSGRIFFVEHLKLFGFQVTAVDTVDGQPGETVPREAVEIDRSGHASQHIRRCSRSGIGVTEGDDIIIVLVLKEKGFSLFRRSNKGLIMLAAFCGTQKRSCRQKEKQKKSFHFQSPIPINLNCPQRSTLCVFRMVKAKEDEMLSALDRVLRWA